jgi:SAM-dependent methyltransferase
MSTFDLYAAYYDLLYGDKDYSQEANYINSLILAHGGAAPSSILELGCGTGGHAAYLARSSKLLHGIDLSPQMVEKAQARRGDLPVDLAHRLTFELGDIRSFRTERKFDVAISLFHVFCYQTSNVDLAAAFATARAHLNPGGLLIFDFWYGPGVLSDRPRTVDKVVEDDTIHVKRHTQPTMQVNENCVDVAFTVDISLKGTAQTQQVVEHHLVRYLFLPEIKQYLDQHNFEFCDAYAWLTQNRMVDGDWYGCVVARAT